jgi:hypothetical protein
LSEVNCFNLQEAATDEAMELTQKIGALEHQVDEWKSRDTQLRLQNKVLSKQMSRYGANHHHY